MITSEEITERKLLENKTLQLKLAQQKELLTAILQTQEAERERIGEALHNGLGQLLYAIRLRTDIYLDTYSTNKAAFQAIDALLEEAIYDTSRISFELVPATLKSHGLEHAIRELARRFSPSGMLLDFVFVGLENRIKEELEVGAFRIVKELLNNVSKHSKATKAKVELIKKTETLRIEVQDNGVGFDVDATSLFPKGIGLQTIQNRARLLNGSILTIAEFGKGTTHQIDIPIRVGKGDGY